MKSASRVTDGNFGSERKRDSVFIAYGRKYPLGYGQLIGGINGVNGQELNFLLAHFIILRSDKTDFAMAVF